MQVVRGWILGVGLGCAAVALAGCGGSTNANVGDDVGSTTSSITSGPLLAGTYLLTGTQTCKSAQGPGSVSFAIFEGSTLTIAGDRATVALTTEPAEAPVTTDGDSFRIHETFDFSGNTVGTRVGEPLPSTALVLELTGTSSDGGQTITGSGFDMGVNCEYTFTGRRSDGPASTAVPIGDPCTASDPTGTVLDAWSQFDPGLGEVRVVSACAEPWALANFEHADTTLVHWNGSSWERGDASEYCATATRAVPVSPPGEDDQAGRILYSVCSPAAQTTTTTSPPPAASTGPCTRAAIQAALPQGQVVLSDPTCDTGWATTDVVLAPENEVLVLLRWNGSAWQLADRWLECGNGTVPASLHDLICLPTD